MTAEEFRRLALSFRGTSEGAHHGHPGFRVGGRVFATLGQPDAGWAMAKLTPAQQQRFVRDHPACFQPVKGAWGRRGATSVSLWSATPSTARRALALAHRNVTSAMHQSAPRHAEGQTARTLKKRAS